MSGGSFNYVCYSIDSADIFEKICDLKNMEDFLREHQKHDAADEVMKFRLDIETHLRIVKAQGSRLQNILHAAEWWSSNDCGEDTFDKEWNNFLEIKQAKIKRKK